MIKFSEPEQKLLRSINDGDLRTSLVDIRTAVASLWADDAPRIIKDFTDHGIKHCERVAAYAERILRINKKQPLNGNEMYLLLAGVYLHDIGMQCDIAGFHQLQKNAKRFGANFNCEFSAKSAGKYTLREQKAVRSNHQYISAAWIDYAHKTAKTPLGKPAQSIPSFLVDDIIDVCLHHSGVPIEKCSETLRFDPNGRLRLVASVLRFSDELDIDANRVSWETIKYFRIPLENQVYWWLHGRSRIDSIGKNIIRISIQMHADDCKELGKIIEMIFISKFCAKNNSVLTQLARWGFPIVISSESGVLKNNRLNLLTPEMVKVFRATAKKEVAKVAKEWQQRIAQVGTRDRTIR